MPGVQTLLPVMLNHVNDGKLSLRAINEFYMRKSSKDIWN